MFKVAAFTALFCASSLASGRGPSVAVHGYIRADGTYVMPYHRSSPDGIFENNWSTKGNINPYTEKAGTQVSPKNSNVRLDRHYQRFFDNAPIAPQSSDLNNWDQLLQQNSSSDPVDSRSKAQTSKQSAVGDQASCRDNLPRSSLSISTKSLDGGAAGAQHLDVQVCQQKNSTSWLLMVIGFTGFLYFGCRALA
jgi:hypothetical protein